MALVKKMLCRANLELVLLFNETVRWVFWTNRNGVRFCFRDRNGLGDLMLRGFAAE